MSGADFTRTASPGVTARGRLFVTIKYTGGSLSVTGVEGPLSNGNCRGSCGQCGIAPDIAPDDGWTPEGIARLRDIWGRWHLNDMRAGCEHQCTAWNVNEPLEVVTYRLTAEAHRLRSLAIARAIGAARGEFVADLDATERALLSPDWFRSLCAPPDADSPLSGCFEVEKRETLSAGSVTPGEHPGGLLTKPCEVCGYRYGSAWLREDVPPEVLDYLRSLKDTECDLPSAWR